MTHGLDEVRIVKQWAEIDRVNKKLKKEGIKMRVLKGTECDILKDGTLDLGDKILSQLEVVGISVHSYFDMKESEQTARIIKAMGNPYAHILFHPTGRLIGKRKPYEVNMDAVMNTAKKENMILEIDASPERLDMKDEHIRAAIAHGIKMTIDSDAHAVPHFSFLEYGISQARRGWAEKKDIVNVLPVEKMLQFVKS
jgi:DNA polymerase (family 10)